jgi:Spy/CpxP family protein refolding chaperone
MKITSNFLVALALASSFSALTPAGAQDTFYMAMPPSEPMFDFPVPPGVMEQEDVLISVGPTDIAFGPDGPGGHGGPGGPGGHGPSTRGPRGLCPMGLGGPFGALTGELALKDDQLEKLHAIKNQMLDATGSQEATLASYQRQLRDLISSPTIDRTKVAAVQAKMNETKAAISNAHLTALMSSHDVLTEEQRKALHDNYLKAGSCSRGFARFRHRGM